VTGSRLQDKVSELAAELEVPGVSVGIVQAGEESYGYAGVTSVENPLPVDETTLFQFGSTGKTFTATAMMRLVGQGKVDLDAPVRTYVPELKLKDEDVAAKVTVLQLLNHTAGWDGDLMDDTGNGDDALEKYVARMERLEQVSPPGRTVSYNNASLSLAGRVIEKVTGTTFEKAIADLLLAPLGLKSTFFFPNDIMTRRFVVGHKKDDDGITVARPWAMPRGGNPAGGLTANARDQIAWARFHLGNGTAPDGSRILTADLLGRMQQPTFDMVGSALGDHVGISWLLAEVDGVRTVNHGGTMIGQYSEFTMVPEREFAVITMANCGPNGAEFNHKIVRWALEEYLGLADPEPAALRLPDAELAAYIGSFETIAATVDITAGEGRLSATVTLKPEMAKVLHEAGEEVPGEQPAIPLALLAGKPDSYVVDEGPAKGMKGYFTRGADGAVDGVHLGGRLATRVATVPA
jgi:CubicO group peptidase (beta-lactamase class C family)